jgi:hypothetical protein
MSEHHRHEHVVQVVALGRTVDEALLNGVAGLTDPQGHHAGLAFDSFEVVRIAGTIGHKSGDHGSVGHIRVTLQATGVHLGK